ncbi:hypothetical protein ACEWY4_026737 [Coilia grayii]|uniref:Uncharacterized protein n=1 Tax=Coilia grayii TaxID=363190 RepID=A0ABD1IQI8_9TELE
MFRHTCLTLLLVLASGSLSSSQTSPTVAPTSRAPTVPTTTAAAPPTTAKTTTLAPTTAKTTTLTPTTAKTTTHAPTTHAPTTHAPTTHAPTTHAPTTQNTTSHAPTTQNTTTPSSQNTTTPAPPLPNPETGNYTLRAQVNSTACLMARMGLQVSYKQDQVVQNINLDPKNAKVSGACGSNGSDSTLTLNSEDLSMTFVFVNASNKFHLGSFNVTVTTATGKFSDKNNSLDLWLASLGSSYMCKKEQSYDITAAVTLHTFDLQVQPFAVEEDKFSTAEDCQADGENYIVPIAVGAALAVLILIVLVAYFIGRKKSQSSGYESF